MKRNKGVCEPGDEDELLAVAAVGQRVLEVEHGITALLLQAITKTIQQRRNTTTDARRIWSRNQRGVQQGYFETKIKMKEKLQIGIKCRDERG